MNHLTHDVEDWDGHPDDRAGIIAHLTTHPEHAWRYPPGYDFGDTTGLAWAVTHRRHHEATPAADVPQPEEPNVNDCPQAGKRIASGHWQDWADLASVYRAGADRARGWIMNNDRQQDAEILDAQADRCDEIARERDGLPPVEHDHPHDDGNRLMHRHRHSHAAGETSHVDHQHADVPGPWRRLTP
jgi:hypothetical protein